VKADFEKIKPGNMKTTYGGTSKLIFSLLALLLSSGCGYFDNDGLKSQKHIVGNIYLQEYGYSDKIYLVHDGGDGMYSIEADCHSVYYDSIENRIYIESLMNEWNTSYYSFILKNPSSRKVWEALEKHEVLEATFKKRITNKSCVQIELTLDELN
jgi:uncharacterized protein with von Willebrand factor type A (vWA) domain